MKRVLSFCFLAFIFTFSVNFFGCGTENLCDNVVELRKDVFSGDYNGVPLHASYGYKVIDGYKNYSLSFILPFDKVVGTTSVRVVYNEQDYNAVFALSEVTGNYLARLNIEDFNVNSFDCTITVGSEHTVVNMVSDVPNGACDYKKAVEFLQKNQPELVDLYRENGIFSANLIVRIIGKEDKCYYYIGIEKGGNLKALLLDGFSGEVLAIRDIK